MKINVSQPCPACDGQCVQLHPSWDQYHGQRFLSSPRDFFLDLGYLPNEELPPLLIPCKDCRGNGEVEAWKPIEVLLPRFRELYKQLRKGQAA
jgi:hypothetical protein